MEELLKVELEGFPGTLDDHRMGINFKTCLSQKIGNAESILYCNFSHFSNNNEYDYCGLLFQLGISCVGLSEEESTRKCDEILQQIKSLKDFLITVPTLEGAYSTRVKSIVEVEIEY